MTAAADRERRAWRYKKGLCSACSRRAVKGHTKCDRCMERQRVYARERSRCEPRLVPRMPIGEHILTEVEVDELQRRYREGH